METLSIEKMAYGPFAISHLKNGKTAFVSGGVPGDIVDACIFEEKKSFVRARVENVIEPSSVRVTPKSPSLLDSLAPWQIMTYDAQLASKQGNIEDALRRVGHFAQEDVQDILRAIIPCDRLWNYRNKIELASTRDVSDRFSLGFYESGSSKVEICDTCELAVKPIDKSPRSLTGALRYLNGNEDLGIYRVGVRASENTGSIQVALWTPPSSFPRSFAAKTLVDSISATSIVRVLADKGSSRRVKKVEVLAGDATWHEKMSDGILFSISAPSFFQVNTVQAQVLVDLVMEGIGDVRNAFVADLYCGAGTFTLPLAKTGADVVAIEQEGSSIRDLRRNATDNDVDIDIICDNVARVLPEIDEMDACIIDPPRSGLDKGVVAEIARAKTKTVAYISCDPQSLSRDLRRFVDFGYGIKSIQPVDLFPQTYHVETVSILHKR